VNFLSPTLAIIVGAIAIPTLLILYFLKLRRKTVEISTTLLWKKAVQDLQANAPFQKLRRNILLFLQLLALLALIAAVAQPLRQERRATGQRHVILIDRSASMSSMDGDGTLPTADAPGVSRLDEAKRQALALVDGLPEGSQFVATSAADQAMVIAFDTSAEPLVPFTSNKRELRQAIESIEPVYTNSALRLAVSTALANLPKRVLAETGQTIEGLQGGEPITLHLYSDGRLPDAASAKPGVENAFQFHAVGSESASNAAIVQLQAERDYLEPSKVSVFVGLQSTYATERAVDIELQIDGQVARIQSVTLPPMTTGPHEAGVADIVARNKVRELAAEVAGNANDVASTTQTLQSQTQERAGVTGTVFKLDDPDGMLVTVALRSPATGQRMSDDVLASDDRASLIVPPARRLAIAVVGRKNLFLGDVLAGLPLAKVEYLSGADYDKAYAAGQAGQWDVVILDGALPSVAKAKVTVTPSASPAPGGEGESATGQAATGQAGNAQPTATPTAPPATETVTTLPLGSFLVFGQVPGGLGMSDRGNPLSASIVDWSREHPVTGRVLLDSLQIAQMREVRVEPGRGVQVLATAERGPAILEINKDDTHALIVPFDYMESNWPFSQWFVAFVGLALEYLGSEVTGAIDARGLGALSELKDRVPMGATGVRIRHPDGTEAPIELAENGSFVYRLPPQLGIYELKWKGQPLGGDSVQGDGVVMRKYAANLLSSEESFVPSAKKLELASAVVQGQAAPSGGATTMLELWPYVLMGVLAILLLEWYVYNRKVQI
jgi:hypothetical protein